MRHARFARGGQGINIGPTKQDPLRAEGEQANNVHAGAHSGVGKDRQIVADRLRHPRQRPGGGDGAIELSAAVIGDHNAVGAQPHGIARILGIKDPFDDQLSWPAVADPLQIVPGDGRVEVVADKPHIVVHGHFVAGIGFDITERQRPARQADVHCPARVGAGLKILSQGGVRPGHS